MDRVNSYRKIVKELLSEYAQYPPAHGQMKMQTIFDDNQDSYLLMVTGWDQDFRVHRPVIHLDIKDNKIWLQHDSTDAEIPEQLLDMGVPRNHLIFGFVPEEERKSTGFAIS